MMQMNHLAALLLLPAVLTAGCAQPDRKEPAGAAIPPVEVAQTPEQRLLYDALTAEIAGHLGNLPESIAHYRRILPHTRELSVIRRAARIMLFGQDYDAADQAVQRWLLLAPESIEARQLAATVSLRRGDMQTAAASLQWILQQADTEEQGFKLIAALLERLQDRQLALRAINTISSAHPDSPHAGLIQARLAFNAEQYEQARRAAQHIVTTEPDNLQAQMILARSLLELGQAEDALTRLQTVIDRHPQASELRLTYARMLVTTSRHERAMEQFEILLAKAPDDTDLIYSTALLAMQIRRYDQAEKHLHTLLNKGSHRQQARYYLGRLHEERREYEQALDWFERVDAPDLYLQARMSAAAVQGKLGRTDKARQRFARLRESRAGEKAAIWMAESEMLRETGQQQASFDVLDAAVREIPDDTDLRYSRALAAERVSRIDLLESDLKQILQQEPEHAHALNALGYTLADKTTRYEEALDYITRALQLAPHDPAIMDSMGWVQYRLGNLQEALRYLRKASAALQDDEIAAHLGEVLWVSGEREEALAVWLEAQREYPDSEILQRTIERFNP